MTRNTLDDWCGWAAAVYAPGTVRMTRVAARSLLDLTGVPVELADTDAADAWWRLLRRRPQTRASYLDGLRRYYSWRHTRTHEPDPTRYLQRPTVARGLPRPIPLGTVELAIGLAGQPVATWLGLGVYAGLRRSEIAALRPGHVWHDAGQVALRIAGKGGRQRLVPVPDTLGRLLAGYGWPTVSASSVYVGVRAALAAAGEPDGAPHRLRHTYACELYAGSGGDLLAVAGLLGHASVATTQVYARVEQTQLRRLVAGVFDGHRDLMIT